MLSRLAEDMAYTLDIANDEHCRKDFSDALEDVMSAVNLLDMVILKKR